MNEEITLKALQTAVDEWIKTYGVRYFNELTNMACLTEEVGELARVIARTYGEQSFKPGEKPNLGCVVGACVLSQSNRHRPFGRNTQEFCQKNAARPRPTPAK